MKTTLLTIVAMLFLAAPASAHGGDRGFGLLGHFGGFGSWGDHHGGLHGLGLGWGLGYELFDPERIQSRFEDRFDMLQMNYNDGVAAGSDFFTSDQYDKIVHKTEWLDDGYGLFVSGVERSIDRLGDVISIVNDDVTFFGDLLTKYQNDGDISPAKLERIEMWIGRVTDRLNSKVDSLTEKQMTLETNLPTYQIFQTDVSTFLSDIVAAGGGMPAASASSAASLASVAFMVPEGQAAMAAAGSLSPVVVPQPAMASFVVMALGGLWARRGRKRP